jgi:hypothetical protein
MEWRSTQSTRHDPKAQELPDSCTSFAGVTAALAEFYVRSKLIVYDNPAKTASHILASERLFRFGVACDLINAASNVALAVALYVLLKRVNQGLALLASLWRLGEGVILGLITINSMVVLRLLDSPFQSFPTDQLQTLMMLFIGSRADGYAVTRAHRL